MNQKQKSKKPALLLLFSLGGVMLVAVFIYKTGSSSKLHLGHQPIAEVLNTNNGDQEAAIVAKTQENKGMLQPESSPKTVSNTVEEAHGALPNSQEKPAELAGQNTQAQAEPSEANDSNAQLDPELGPNAYLEKAAALEPEQAANPAQDNSPVLPSKTLSAAEKKFYRQGATLALAFLKGFNPKADENNIPLPGGRLISRAECKPQFRAKSGGQYEASFAGGAKLTVCSDEAPISGNCDVLLSKMVGFGQKTFFNGRSCAPVADASAGMKNSQASGDLPIDRKFLAYKEVRQAYIESAFPYMKDLIGFKPIGGGK